MLKKKFYQFLLIGVENDIDGIADATVFRVMRAHLSVCVEILSQKLFPEWTEPPVRLGNGHVTKNRKHYC
jgi:hypothetical protein